MNKSTNSFKHTWRMPFLLAVLTIAGLLSALLGTGAWRILSWVLLSVPLAIIIWFGRKKR